MSPARWPARVGTRISEDLVALKEISVPKWFWIPISFLVANSKHFKIRFCIALYKDSLGQLEATFKSLWPIVLGEL